MSASSLILPMNMTGASGIGAPVHDLPRDPEPPESVQRELAAEDPRWFLRFSRFPRPHWDVCERWLADDPKRSRIRLGEIPPDADFDVLCYCPPDIRAGEVVGYVRSKLFRVTDAAKHAQQEITDRGRANQATKAKRFDSYRSMMEREHAHMTGHDARVLAGAEAAHPLIIVPNFHNR